MTALVAAIERAALESAVTEVLVFAAAAKSSDELVGVFLECWLYARSAEMTGLDAANAPRVNITDCFSQPSSAACGPVYSRVYSND